MAETRDGGIMVVAVIPPAHGVGCNAIPNAIKLYCSACTQEFACHIDHEAVASCICAIENQVILKQLVYWIARVANSDRATNSPTVL